MNTHTETFEIQSEIIPQKARDIIVDMLLCAYEEHDPQVSNCPIKLDQLSSEVEKRHE